MLEGGIYMNEKQKEKEKANGEKVLTELDLHTVHHFLPELFLNLVDFNVGNVTVHRAVIDSIAHAASLGLGVRELVNLKKVQRKKKVEKVGQPE